MKNATIRARLLAVALLTAASFGAAKGTPMTQEKFQAHYALWQAYISRPEVQLSSKSSAYTDCSTYRAIVGLGPKALPYIVEKMREGQATGWKESQFFLWHAAKKLSGKDLSDGKLGVSEQEMARRYVAWWDQSHPKTAPSVLKARP